VSWLAKKLAVNKQSMYQWIDGTNPRDEAIWTRIAAVLDVPESILIDDTKPLPPAPNAEILSDRKTIEGFTTTAAIRSWRGALAGFNGEECYLWEDGVFEVPTAFMIGGPAKIDQHDVVRVSGMSMSPRVLSGDRVIIYRDPTLIRNSIVLATSPELKVYLKVLRHVCDRWELDSLGLGDHFPDLTGWKVHGYAITILRSDDDEPGPNVEWRTGKPLRA